MGRRRAEKDLFGQAIPRPRPKYEATIERLDKKYLAERAARVRWLADVMPSGYFMMPIETNCVFEDAKNSYVYGNFVATVVLAAAFVEHWFSAALSAKGYEKQASRGLAASVGVARQHKLVNPLLLDKVDHLRQIRNPFVHLKADDHEHNLTRRSCAEKTVFWEQLEADAQEALITMYGIASFAFSRDPGLT